MNPLGGTLTLLMGDRVPAPAPPPVLEALESVEVTHSDRGRSGFQITLRAGRGRADLMDDPLLALPALRPCSRVVMIVAVQGVPEVVMDGIVMDQQYTPSDSPGASHLTLTGEDVSVMMDLEERSVEHPAQSEPVIVYKILAQYAQYGVVPKVVPPPSLDVPLPVERTPVQQETDLQYLQEMAERFGYTFFVTPGPAPLVNTAYWGPPPRLGAPQRALIVGPGPHSNAEIAQFRYDGNAPIQVQGRVQDRNTGQDLPVRSVGLTRPPLATQPAWATQDCVATRQFRHSGLSAAQAFAQAQGEVDIAAERAVEVSGSLDVLRYRGVLKPRALVGVRGAGYAYDGLYYVQRVTHQIRRGGYTQRFTLTREGLGATTPAVPP